MTRIPFIAAAVIAVAAVTAAGSYAVATRRSGVPAPSAAEVAKLRADAYAVAARDGEQHPTGGTVVATTRKAINALNGGTEVNTDQDVYVVTLHGHFVGNDFPVPHGHRAPSSSVLTLVYDAATNQVVDEMYGPVIPDGGGAQLRLAG